VVIAPKTQEGSSLLSRRILVGTSGYSFADWVGPFYPPGTRSAQMFDRYVEQFPTVEVNYTFYRMPSARTIASLARRSPDGFDAWVKANQDITHHGRRELVPEFMDNLYPLAEAGKLAGVLLQFPQSFHRTIETRKHLAGVLASFAAAARPQGESCRLAVEFRHRSWAHPSVPAGLAERNVALVVPDVPEIPDLYRTPATVTADVGYLRLHSRNAKLWYAGAVERYDYSYSDAEMRDLYEQWADLSENVQRVYVFFNNCHRAQATENAEAFQKIVESLPG
jgi:uncharacterized protein YecE (DUF72 family)